MKRRRVAVGDVIEMVMSEAKSTGLMAAIGGEVRTVRVLDGHVLILNPDGTPWIRYEPSHELVGIDTDLLGGLWVDQVPRQLVRVFRHGAPVSVPMTRAVHAVRWLEHCTPFDPVRALRDEGYEIVDIKRRG